MYFFSSKKYDIFNSGLLLMMNVGKNIKMQKVSVQDIFIPGLILL